MLFKEIMPVIESHLLKIQMIHVCHSEDSLVFVDLVDSMEEGLSLDDCMALDWYKYAAVEVEVDIDLQD